jgi:L-histidine N-alpha-methyltransferase
MPAAPQLQLSPFALDVAEGLFTSGQKSIPSRHLYDALGSTLFEAITLLPEYGLTRADMSLLSWYAPTIARLARPVCTVAELGSGSGSKARYLLRALGHPRTSVTYYPIDVSEAALECCRYQLSGTASVHPVCADWVEGLKRITDALPPHQPILVMFAGSSIGNLERRRVPDFLKQIRVLLRSGDFFLLGADLVKGIDTMLAAYDDPTGVTAAFNLNLLGRINRELGGEFDLRSFAHEARWNQVHRRIEMHLISRDAQKVRVSALEAEVEFEAGESIWTESSHKFLPSEIEVFARHSEFETVAMWTDPEWPFVEALWRAL